MCRTTGLFLWEALQYYCLQTAVHAKVQSRRTYGVRHRSIPRPPSVVWLAVRPQCPVASVVERRCLNFARSAERRKSCKRVDAQPLVRQVFQEPLTVGGHAPLLARDVGLGIAGPAEVLVWRQCHAVIDGQQAAAADRRPRSGVSSTPPPPFATSVTVELQGSSSKYFCSVIHVF